jgi:hypothetical protein
VSEANANDDVEVLMFDTESIQNIHLEMGRRALRDGHRDTAVKEGTWTVEQGQLYLLADMLRSWYEDIIDDIRIRRHGYKPRQTAAEWEYRQTLIATFARRAFEALDFHELARTILDRLKGDRP